MLDYKVKIGLVPLRRNTTDRPKGTFLTWHSAEERGKRFVDYIDVDKVHVIANGVVKADGGIELLQKINEEGFDWLLDDEDEDDIPRANIVGTCAFNNKKDL